MNVENLKANLAAQGLSQLIIDSMIKSMKKEPKEKKATAKRWFPGMATNAKVETDVEVTCVCECCGNVTVSIVNMKIAKGSPETQKTAVSICAECPDSLRKCTKDELISIILMKDHPANSVHNNTTRNHRKMAKKLKPEDVINIEVHTF